MNSKSTIKTFDTYLHTATITPEIVAVFHLMVLLLILKQLCLCIQEYITKWPLPVYGPPPYNEGICSQPSIRFVRVPHCLSTSSPVE